MKAFNEWNPWMKLDPQLQSTYSGVSGQIGDQHCWKSDKKMWKWMPRNHSTYSKSETKTKMAFEGQGEATSDIVLTARRRQATKWFGR